MHALDALSVKTLHQCRDLLSRITQQQYTQRSTHPPQSTISKHVRHTLERFQVFTRSVESGTALDFDVVVKNRSIEWDLDVARRVLSSLISFFEDGAGELNRSVRLTIHTPEPVTLQSTYARELHFVIVHAIHHYALIRMIAVGEMSINVDQGFGRAPVRGSKM